MGEVVWQGRVQRSRLTGDTASHHFRVWKKKKTPVCFCVQSGFGKFCLSAFYWMDRWIYIHGSAVRKTTVAQPTMVAHVGRIRVWLGSVQLDSEFLTRKKKKKWMPVVDRVKPSCLKPAYPQNKISLSCVQPCLHLIKCLSSTMFSFSHRLFLLSSVSFLL